MVDSGFQVEAMRYLEDEVKKYASFKPERSKAIRLTYSFPFVFVRLMDDLYSKKRKY
jgi:hypothetical protein